MLGISSELSTCQMIHMKCQALFSLNSKKKFLNVVCFLKLKHTVRVKNIIHAVKPHVISDNATDMGQHAILGG